MQFYFQNNEKSEEKYKSEPEQNSPTRTDGPGAASTKDDGTQQEREKEEEKKDRDLEEEVILLDSQKGKDLEEESGVRQRKVQGELIEH